MQALFEGSLLDQGNEIAAFYAAQRCRTAYNAEAYEQSCLYLIEKISSSVSHRAIGFSQIIEI